MTRIYATELPTPALAKDRGLVLVEVPPNCHVDGDVGQMRRAIDELAAIARACIAHGPPTNSSEKLDLLIKTEKLQRLEFDQSSDLMSCPRCGEKAEHQHVGGSVVPIFRGDSRWRE